MQASPPETSVLAIGARPTATPTKQRWSGQSSSSPRTDVNHLIREINLPGERFDTVLEPLRPVMMGSEDPKATDNGGLNDPCDLEPPPKHIPPPSRDHPPTPQQASIASLRMRALQRRPTTTMICPPESPHHQDTQHGGSGDNARCPSHSLVYPAVYNISKQQPSIQFLDPQGQRK